MMPVVPFTQRDPDQLDDSLMPSQTHLLMAASIAHEQGVLRDFRNQDQKRDEIADIAKEWRGKKKAPKEEFDPEKAKGDPVEPEVFFPSEVSPFTGKQRLGLGRT